MNRGWVFCLLVLGAMGNQFTQAYPADEAELRERIQAMVRESKELAEQGRMEEAKRVKMEAAALMEKLKHEGRGEHLGGPRTDLDHAIARQETLFRDLRNKLERLQSGEGSPEDRNAVKEHLMRVERELDELRAERKRRHGESQHRDDGRPHGPDGDQERMLAKMHERLNHFAAAAEHLEQAGLPDVAEMVRRRGGELKREFEERMRHFREQRETRGPRGPEDNAELRELRELVGRLQAENRELRERAERPRPE